ncbi:MAG: ABC transporter permease, partial [Clostridia bacterium]|nr:ABC transporter permease [Clostridia bacterium]
ILKIALFGLAVILCSVWTSMKVMSVKDPMSLIVTEDNSNLVSSPMRSINVFGEAFPTKYELFSMWRFRKYNIQLLTTAIVFCALFIMGLYMADIYTTDLEYPRPQFIVDLSDSPYPYDDIMSEELYGLEGIRAVEITDNVTEGRHIASHILVHHKGVKAFKNLVTYEGTEFDTAGDGYRASNDVLYTAMNAEQIQILEDYDYEGDLTSLLTGENVVIVGESISNVPTFKYKVGDKIWIGVKNGQIRSVDSNLTGRALLKDQIQYFHFDYIECTIGAIIYDIPSGSTPIYMTMDLYEEVTGKKPSSTTLNLYVEREMDNDSVNALYDEVRDWGRQYGDVKVSNARVALQNEIDADKHYTELFIVIALLVLSISPLVWFYSQNLYYRKREKEFNILQSIGAIMKEIRQIYVQGGLCMAAMSLFVSIGLSYIGSYILFYIYNVVMPYFSGENVRYVFYMPWYAILTSIVMSVFCGFFSTYLPYRSYAKYRYSLENGGAGGEFGDEE